MSSSRLSFFVVWRGAGHTGTGGYRPVTTDAIDSNLFLSLPRLKDLSRLLCTRCWFQVELLLGRDGSETTGT